MCPLLKSEATNRLAFATWKLHLRRDCELTDKLPAFNAMGDSVLQFLWERGLDPTVKAIVEDCPDHYKEKPI